MDGPVATCAGSSGGAEPPGDPTRLPAHCESAPEGRRVRGPTRNKGVHKLISAGKGKIPVFLDTEGKTYKALGTNAARLSNVIGHVVRSKIPPYYESWKEVPAMYKDQILPEAQNIFDLDITPVSIGSIDREAKDRYKEWKNTLHDTFRSMGGVEAVDEIKKTLPLGVRTLTDWEKCCDRFTNPKFLEKSRRNSANRAKVKQPSRHGTRSYANRRFMRRNTETGELLSILQNWRECHMKGDQWVNEAARLRYEEMERLYLQQTQAATASGSESGSSEAVNEEDIAETIMGRHRGHRKGVGPRMKKDVLAAAAVHEARSQQPTIPQDVQQWIDQMSSSSQDQQRFIREMMVMLRRVAPGFDLPRPPQSPPPPLFQQPRQNNDDADDDDLTNL